MANQPDDDSSENGSTHNVRSPCCGVAGSREWKSMAGHAPPGWHAHNECTTLQRHGAGRTHPTVHCDPNKYREINTVWCHASRRDPNTPANMCKYIRGYQKTMQLYMTKWMYRSAWEGGKYGHIMNHMAGRVVAHGSVSWGGGHLGGNVPLPTVLQPRQGPLPLRLKVGIQQEGHLALLILQQPAVPCRGEGGQTTKGPPSGRGWRCMRLQQQ